MYEDLIKTETSEDKKRSDLNLKKKLRIVIQDPQHSTPIFIQLKARLVLFKG